VHRVRRMGAVIDHPVAVGDEPRLELLLERVAGMVRPYRDDRHTRTIPIVARGVKRPNIWRKRVTRQETAAGPAAGKANVYRGAASAPFWTRLTRARAPSATRLAARV